MAKFEGVLGKVSEAIFNESAKGAMKTAEYSTKYGLSGSVSYTPYKLTNKLGSFVAAGAATGAIGTTATTVTNNYLDDRNPANGLGNAVVRGALTGAAVGGAVNVVPKLLHNQLARSGIKKFDGALDIADDMLNIWSPVISEFDTKVITQGGKKIKVNTEDPLKMFSDRWKEAKRSIDGDPAPGERSMVLYNNLIRDVDPATFLAKSKSGVQASKEAVAGATEKIKDKGGAKKVTADQLLRLKRMKTNFEDANRKMNQYTGENPEFQEWKDWVSESTKRAASMGRADRMSIGANLLTQLGFNSTYHHIVEPTGKFISNVKSGNFKNINLEQGAAAAFSAYGAYEAAHVTSDVAEGDWYGALKGAALLAGGKLAYGVGVDLVKLDAKRRAAGIKYSSAFKAYNAHRLFEDFSSDSMKMTEGQFRNVQRNIQGKAFDVLKNGAPDTAAALSAMENTLRSEAVTNDNAKTLFQLGVESFNSGHLLKGMRSDYERNVPKEQVDFLKSRIDYYTSTHGSDLLRAATDIQTGNKSNIRKFNTTYSNLYNDLHKDIIHENYVLDYDAFISDVFSGNKSRIFKAFEDLGYHTKIVQDRAASSLPELKTYRSKKAKAKMAEGE